MDIQQVTERLAKIKGKGWKNLGHEIASRSKYHDSYDVYSSGSLATDIPWLIEQVEALQAENARLRAALALVQGVDHGDGRIECACCHMPALHMAGGIIFRHFLDCQLKLTLEGSE